MKFINSIIMVCLLTLFALPSSVADVCVQQCVPERPMIDVVFVIDSTGSMNDEIRTVKTHLTKIIKEVELGQPKPNLRIGVVAFRDYPLEEKEYLIKKLELTDDINKAVRFIQNIQARGGGDYPEAVEYGLNFAINKMTWRLQYPNNYKKLVFLVGDAAPHGEGSSDRNYVQGSPYGYNYKQNIKDAKAKDIHVYTIAGSGIDYVGVRVFKEIASQTGGAYEKLSYYRQNVQQYYAEEGFEPVEVEQYVAQAKMDADYDEADNSILTNTLGVFASKAMKAEAVSAGVDYGSVDDTPVDPIVDDPIIIDDPVDPVIDTPSLPPHENRLMDFLRNIFKKLSFWR